MDNSTMNARLLFMRRMLWWLPPLVFAVWLTALAMTAVPVGLMSMVEAIVQALVAGAVVGVLVVGVYFGYKLFLERNPVAKA
jgi:hypothetical protein